MKCIAIDDEPMALEIVTEYIEKTPFLTLEKSFRSALQALAYLQNHQVDLLFLDINMPDLSGTQFLKTLQVQPLVIFTTAYSEYALESYDYNATDYLLKPIEFDRFLKAAHKAFQLHSKNAAGSSPAPLLQTSPQPMTEETSVLVKSGTQIHQIKPKDIWYIEGAGNYITLMVAGQKILSLWSMNQALSQLSSNDFIRIHKSYIVAFSHIQTIERHQVIVREQAIPIGNTYRELFFKLVDERMG